MITNNMEFTYDELVATCYVLYGGKRTPKIIIEFIKMYQLIKKEHFKNTKLAALKGVFYTEEDGTWNLINGKSLSDILPYLNYTLAQILYSIDCLKSMQEEELKSLIDAPLEEREEKGFQKTIGGINEG